MAAGVIQPTHAMACIDAQLGVSNFSMTCEAINPKLSFFVERPAARLLPRPQQLRGIEELLHGPRRLQAAGFPRYIL